MEYLVKGQNVFPFYLRQVGNNLSQDKPACWSTGGTNHRHMEDAITVHKIVKELNMKTSKYENMKTPSPVLLTIHTCQICQRALFTGTHDRVSSISEPFSSKIVCISSVHKVDQH